MENNPKTAEVYMQMTIDQIVKLLLEKDKIIENHKKQITLHQNTILDKIDMIGCQEELILKQYNTIEEYHQIIDKQKQEIDEYIEIINQKKEEKQRKRNASYENWKQHYNAETNYNEFVKLITANY